MNDNPILVVKQLSKTINNNVILSDINFDIYPNQVVSIIGPSGAGKTTLLRILNGLTNFEQGEVQIQNELLDYKSKLVQKQLPEKIGLVFQNFNLYPHLTVMENITLSPLLKAKSKHDKEAITQKAYDWLDMLQIRKKSDEYPFQLSGGEKQRVAIARAGISNPAILCFDEPTSALDPLLTLEVAKMIRKIAEKTTVLIITHDMEFAKSASDQIIEMNSGQIKRRINTSDYFK